MITLVSTSVIATVIVIHMSRITHKPAPSWIQWLVLNKLPRFVCIDDVGKWHRHMQKSSFRSSTTCSEKCAIPTVSNNGVSALSKSTTNNVNASTSASNFEQVVEEEQQNQHEWKLVSLVVDRYLMVIFSIATIVITVTILAIIIIGSREEFDKEIDILNNSWKMATRRSM